jgi:hypothetical protein
VRQDARAAPAAAYRQDRLDGRVREHRHHVGGAIAIGAGERSAAIEQVRATLGHEAERGQRVLDDVDVDRLPRGAGRIDEADHVAGDEPGRAYRLDCHGPAGLRHRRRRARRHERGARRASGQADERAP